MSDDYYPDEDERREIMARTPAYVVVVQNGKRGGPKGAFGLFESEDAAAEWLDRQPSYGLVNGYLFGYDTMTIVAITRPE